MCVCVRVWVWMFWLLPTHNTAQESLEGGQFEEEQRAS